MIISRKFIKWKVLLSVVFLFVFGILFVGNFDTTNVLSKQRNKKRIGSSNRLGNVDNIVPVIGVQLPLSHFISQNTSSDYIKNIEHDNSSKVKQANLDNPAPVEQSPVAIEGAVANLNRPVLNITHKNGEKLLSSVENKVKPTDVLPILRPPGNLSKENPPKISVDYADCASAKVKPIHYYPEFTAVVSAHGSGNTWVRYLIERATGVSTGSYYHDPKLYRGGFLGEMANPLHRNTIAIKTHHPFQNKNIVFQNAIVIVRDPFEVVIAERNRIVSQNGHTTVVSDSHFKGPDWEKFARGHSRYWEHSCRECITIPNYLIVYYSVLKQNLEEELRRILKFLNVEPDEKRIACTLAYPDGKFKRKKKEKRFDPFDRELIEEINGHIRNVTMLFKEHDIQPLPFHERDLTELSD